MADLRATLVTPGVNSNAALSAATDAFANLQKQMNAPFERKLESDIREQNRQDKLNEINYQHGRDAIMDQRYKDEKLLEQKKYNQTLAEKQANSEYLLAKTNPTALGSSTAQREYDAALSANGLSDQDRADIKAVLGDNYVKDRSSGVVNSALTNPLVSGDTVYNYDNSEKDRLFKEKQLLSTEKYQNASLANDATRIQMEKDKVAKENARQNALYGSSLYSPDVKITEGGAIVEQTDVKKGKTLGGVSVSDDNLKNIENDLNAKYNSPEYLKLIEDKKNMEGLTEKNYKDEKLLKNQFESQKVKDKDMQGYDPTTGNYSGGIGNNSTTKSEYKLIKEKDALSRDLSKAKTVEEQKPLEEKIKNLDNEILKENSKHNFESFKKVKENEFKNKDQNLTNLNKKIEDFNISAVNDVTNKYGEDNIVKDNRIAQPQEVATKVASSYYKQMIDSNPNATAAEKEGYKFAAYTKGEEASKNQKEYIDSIRSANTKAAEKYSQFTYDIKKESYTALLKMLDDIKKQKVELAKKGDSNTFRDSSNLKNMVSSLDKDEENTKAELDVLRTYISK